MIQGPAAAAFLLAARALVGEDRAVFLSTPGATLEAGQRVEISWSLPEVGSDSFSEMELVLSLDGGRTFPVRVTRELDPKTRSLSWRVPALPALHARLALRGGDRDAPAAEEILNMSEEFSIELSDGRPLEPTVAVGGELRTREALERAAQQAPPAAPSLGERLPGWAPFQDLPAAGLERPRFGAEPALASAASALFELSNLALPPCTPGNLARRPADTPRRE